MISERREGVGMVEEREEAGRERKEERMEEEGDGEGESQNGRR